MLTPKPNLALNARPKLSHPWLATIVLFLASIHFAGCCAVTGDCKDDSQPFLESVDPQTGLPGIEITLIGTNLKDPLIDPSARVYFDDIEIQAKPIGEEIDPSVGVITFWGLDSDGFEKIRLRTPIRQPTNKVVEIYVKNELGTSNKLLFFDGDASTVACFETATNIADCSPFKAYAGAIILQGSEEVLFFRIEKTGTELDPILSTVPWDENSDLTNLRVPFGANGYVNTGHDIRLDSFGSGAIALSQTPGTQGTDGLHGVLIFDDGYSSLFTAYETGLLPTRLVSTGLDRSNPTERNIAALSYGASQIKFMKGEGYGTHRLVSLTAVSPIARPTAAAFWGADTLFVAGTDAFSGDAWLAQITLGDGTTSVTKLSASLGDVTPVDVVVYGWDDSETLVNYTDVYVAFNRGQGSESQAGILRYRSNTANTDIETSTLLLTTGTRIGAMLLDGRSHFGHPVKDSRPRVVQLFATVDDQNDNNNDHLLAIRLNAGAFPSSDSNYTDWYAHMVSLAAAQLAAYNAATQAAYDLAITISPADATTAIAHVTEPAAPMLKIALLGDQTTAFTNPYAMTLLPININVERAPSFLMVSNPGNDSITLVRTDGAGTLADIEGSLRPGVGRLDGLAWQTVSTGAGSQPGRLYCTQTQ